MSGLEDDSKRYRGLESIQSQALHSSFSRTCIS